MENKNVLTINFNNIEDLALQIAEWNETLNHQCCGSCHDSKAPTATVCETIDVEAVEPKTTKNEKVEVKKEKISTKAAEKQETPVTDFEGNPTKPKNEENVKPAETTKVKEPTPAEHPQQDTELDVATEPVDKKAFYKEFREWMGADAAKAKKAISVFGKHGVSRPSSDSLTDDLITDLKSIMAEEA